MQNADLQTPILTPSGKKRLRRLAALFFVLSLGTGILFANNAVSTIRWWMLFAQSGGDASVLAAAKSLGIWRQLSWSAVDGSCVTTFIPFFGCFLAMRSLWHASCGKIPGARENFPFFATFDSLNIALGLIGTLWGVILIGYFQMDTVGMEDLMMCLHTALFSTLMAVIWVYLVDRPWLRPWLQRALEEACEKAPAGPTFEEEEADVLAALARFNQQAQALASTWKQSAEAALHLEQAGNKAATALHGVVSSCEQACNSLQKELTHSVQELCESLTRQQEQQRAREEQLAQAMEARLQRMEQGAEQNLSFIEKLASIVSSATKLQSEFAEETKRICAERDAAGVKAAEAAGKMISVQGELSETRGSLRAQQQNNAALLETLQREQQKYETRLQELRSRNDDLSQERTDLELRAKVAEQRAKSGEQEVARLKKMIEKLRSVFAE